MSQSSGPYTDRYGLVFGYDTSEIVNSYKGEPTTNIAYATNNSLNSGSNWWVNGGSTTFNDDDTSIPKPIIPNVNTSGLKIFSSTVTGAGSNQQLGSSIIGISPSTQYTMSIYFWFQGSTLQAAPYLRTAVNNNSLGAFAYNGDTNYLNWPRGKWIRLSVTFTTQSNETGVYMSSYTGDYVGEKLAYFGYQLEQKDHMTPLVLGTRSSTQGLIDIVNNNTINLANVSYDSNGMIQFDGTDDYINVSSSSNYAFGTGAFTIEVMIYPQSFSNYTHMVALPDQSVFALKANVSDGAIYYYDPSFTTYGSTPGWTLTLNTWNHVVIVRDGTTAYCYLNGVLRGSVAGFTGNFSTQQMRIGWGAGSEFTTKKINVVKIYNKQLSATDVLNNYNNYKKRFGI